MPWLFRCSVLSQQGHRNQGCPAVPSPSRAGSFSVAQSSHGFDQEGSLSQIDLLSYVLYAW